MNVRYIKNSKKDYRKYGVGILFSDGSALNEIAAIIFEMCDGQTSIAEIVDFLYDEFECEKSTLIRDVTECVNNMQEIGLIEQVK